MTLHGPDVALVSGRDREEPEQYPSPSRHQERMELGILQRCDRQRKSSKPPYFNYFILFHRW